MIKRKNMIMKILTLIAIALVAVQAKEYNPKVVRDLVLAENFVTASYTGNLAAMRANEAGILTPDFNYNPGNEYCHTRSPLHDAIYNNDPEIVNYLLNDLNGTTTTRVCYGLMEDEMCTYSPLAFAKKQLQRVMRLFGSQSETSKNANEIVDILKDEAESRNPTCPNDD